MKNLIFLSFIFVAFSVGASINVPRYCVGIFQQNKGQKIELNLNYANNFPPSVYYAMTPMNYRLDISTGISRKNFLHYSGSMGSFVSWRMELNSGGPGNEGHWEYRGILTLSFYNSHDPLTRRNPYAEEKYNVTCKN